MGTAPRPALDESVLSRTELELLLRSAGMGSVHLDQELRVLGWTPLMETLLPLQAADVGQPISELGDRFGYPALLEDVRRACLQRTAIERELQVTEDRWLLIRLRANRNDADDIEGVFLTAVDISSIKRIEDRVCQLSAGRTPLVCYVDASLQVRFLNNAYREGFGINPQDNVGRTVREFVGEERYPQIEPFVMRALAGEVVKYELPHLDRRGVQREYHVEYLPHRSPTGEVLGFYALLFDMADRRRTEQALQDSQALYDSLGETLPLSIMRKDREGRFIFVNGQFCRYSGKTRDELIGRTDFDLYPRELAEKYRRNDLKVMNSGEVFEDIEMHQTEHSGQRFVQVLKSPVHDARMQIIGTQVIFWDVTDRRRAEEQARESSERMRAMFDSALDCIITMDHQGKILEFNRAAENTFGYRRDEVIGRDMAELLFAPAAQHRHHDNLERYLATREQGSLLGRRLEQLAQCKNGTRIITEMTMQPVPLEGSMVFTIFLRDITDRKRAEEEIRRKNHDLETLLFVISHDLREPLRTVANFSKMVHDRYAPQLDAKGQDFLRRAVNGTERMDQLLEDILMLSRAQRSSEPREELDTVAIVNEVLRRLEHKISSTQARVQVLPDLPQAWGDRLWITQAVFNLVANALKFTQPGQSPDIEIAPYAGEDEGGPCVGLMVRDRGPGVAPSHAERIFQLFQRAVGREIEGTGAGLAIVRQIAERHGGKAWVRPREGGGSEFIITFGSNAAPQLPVRRPLEADTATDEVLF